MECRREIVTIYTIPGMPGDAHGFPLLSHRETLVLRYPTLS